MESEFLSHDEVYRFYTNAFTIGGWIAMLITALAIITTLVFRKQRKFPTSLILWICASNLVFMVYLVIKWSPFSKLHIPLVFDIGKNYSLCVIEACIVNFLEFAAVITNTLVAHALYMVICKDKSIKVTENPWYQRIYTTIFWIVSVVFGLVPTFIKVTDSKGWCSLNSNDVVYLKVIPWFGCTIIQIIFLVPTLFHIKRISKGDVDKKSKGENVIRRGTFVLFLRFFGCMLVQLLAWFPWVLLDIVSVFGPVPKSHYQAIGIGLPLGAILDALILIFGNHKLLCCLRECYQKVIAKFSNNQWQTKNESKVYQTQFFLMQSLSPKASPPPPIEIDARGRSESTIFDIPPFPRETSLTSIVQVGEGSVFGEIQMGRVRK